MCSTSGGFAHRIAGKFIDLRIELRNLKIAPPYLIVVFGLPGTGKTTFAKALAAELGIDHFNTDILRTQLGKRQRYREADKALIYGEMLERTARLLGEGKAVVVDGTFYRKVLREQFRDLAAKHGIKIIWIEVSAEPEVVRERIAAKRQYSEADFEVYLKVREEFEPPDHPIIQVFSDRDSVPEMVGKAINALPG